MGLFEEFGMEMGMEMGMGMGMGMEVGLACVYVYFTLHVNQFWHFRDWGLWFEE